MLRKTKLITALMSIGFVAGCSSMPDISGYERQTSNDAKNIAMQNSSWSSSPAIQREYVRIGETKSAKNYIPEDIRNRMVDIMLQPDATFRDFMTGVSKGLSISGYIQSEELVNRGVYIPYYQGPLGELLDNISYNLNVSFIYRNGMLTLNDSVNYMVTIPNNNFVAERISNALSSFGATDVVASPETGMIVYNATDSTQERVEVFLDRIIRNSANVNLQVLFINVNVDSERRSGFDWSGLQATIGDLGLSSIDMAERATGAVARVTGSSVSGRVSRSEVDIQGVFNILNTYGDTRTLQDFNMTTISGREVNVGSIQRTPYIDELTSSTTVDSVTSSGVNTKEAENGIQVRFVPVYDSESELISLDIDMSLKTLLGFTVLNAGDRGQIEQPRTQEQSFNNSLRMRAGETIVLGGITYSSVSDNRNMPFIFEPFNRDLASKNENITENSLFIVLRATVTEYLPIKLGGDSDE